MVEIEPLGDWAIRVECGGGYTRIETEFIIIKLAMCLFGFLFAVLITIGGPGSEG